MLDPAARAVPTDIAPRRQQPALIFLDAVRGLGSLLIPFVLFFFAGGEGRQGWFLVFIALGIVGSLIFQYVGWRNYTYAVTGGEFREQSGVLERKDRLIPLERIQAVDINETPLQRLFGVVGVRIETAAGGAGEADVKIGALTRADAELLRDRLGQNPRAVAAGLAAAPAGAPAGGDDQAPAAVADEVPARRLSTGQLLLSGLTSGTIGPALAVVGFLSQIIDDILPEELWARWAMTAATLSPRTVIPLVVAVGVFAWLLAIAGAVLTYGNFALRRVGDRVMISHGLLERRRRTVPVARMQALVVKEGLLRRPFGLAAIGFESAGYGAEQGESGVLWPLMRRKDVPDFVAAVVPEMEPAFASNELAGPPPRAFSRYLVLDLLAWAVTSLVVLGVVWVLATGRLFPPLGWLEWWWGALLFIGLPLVALNAVLRFRDAGWRIDGDDFLVVQAGGLVRTLTVIPRRRLQRRVIESNPLQRRAELATLRVAVASGGEGGKAAVEHLDAAVAADVAARLAPPAVSTHRPRRAAPAVLDPAAVPGAP